MTDTEFLPVNDGLIVEEVEIDKTSEGGIVLPGSKRGKYCEGTVIAVSEGLASREGTKITPGMRVVWPKGQGTDLYDCGKSRRRLSKDALHLVRIKDPE